MPLSRPALPLLMFLAAGVLGTLSLTGCGGDEPREGLEDATEDLVEASRERFEASEEFKEAAAEAQQAAAAAERQLAEAEPSMEAAIEENLDAAEASLDGAKEALGEQADDLFGEVEAAIAERRYPQAGAALDTLKRMPGAEPALADRISAAEESLAEAQCADETLGSARAAIDAAKAGAAETAPPSIGEGLEIGSPPADEPALEK